MKSFLILLSEKQPNLLTDHLLKLHTDYLKELRNKGHLPICGPLLDNMGAVFIIRADSKDAADILIKNDPFIRENYYKKYVLNEFMEANDQNNWLMESAQTKSNLNE